MLLDHRTYTVRAGCLRKQMALYEKHGLAHQKRHFGEPLAWLVSETGDVNSYVHIWVYEDAEDRNRKRAALFKDPEWLKYIEMNAEAGYLLKQESKLMSPAPFAPIQALRKFGSMMVIGSRRWLAACLFGLVLIGP